MATQPVPARRTFDDLVNIDEAITAKWRHSNDQMFSEEPIEVGTKTSVHEPNPEQEQQMEAFLTLWTYLQTRTAAAREDGMVAIEYVILGALVVAGIGPGFAAFSTDLSARFAALL